MPLALNPVEVHFGIFRQGPCLEHALVASHKYARSQGRWLRVLNEGERRPGYASLGVQRRIQLINKEWSAFSSTTFCDPRNL